MKRIILWTAGIVAILAMLLVVLAIVYTMRNPVAQPDARAIAALESDESVDVVDGDWLVFTPLEDIPATGLILYPGGAVDHRAYAPVAKRIAEAGYLVVIPPMPFHLAIFGANRASAVIDAYPQISHWAIGGHSLGGVMAAQFASRNLDVIDGLALWASFPMSRLDLSDADLLVTSIYGTRDGLVTLDEIDESRNRLPPATVFARIEGGNHAQFGSYGAQDGDLAPEISAEEQQAQIADATVQLLSQLEW